MLLLLLLLLLLVSCNNRGTLSAGGGFSAATGLATAVSGPLLKDWDLCCIRCKSSATESPAFPWERPPFDMVFVGLVGLMFTGCSNLFAASVGVVWPKFTTTTEFTRSINQRFAFVLYERVLWL